jgi:hypothetical protein
VLHKTLKLKNLIISELLIVMGAKLNIQNKNKETQKSLFLKYYIHDVNSNIL